MNAVPKHRKWMIAVTGGLALSLAGGCAEAEEFRAIASGQVQSGLTSIVTGLINGVFAVIEPDQVTDDQ